MKQLFLYTTLLLMMVIGSCKKKQLLPESRIAPADLLSGKKYGKMQVEILFEKGYTLDAQTISSMQNFLTSRLNKPDGIFFTAREIPPQGRAYASLGDVKNLENIFRRNYSGGNVLSVCIIVIGSDYSGNGNSKTLGIAYNSTSFVLFGKTINAFSGGLTQPPRTVLETTVGEHEFGHLMGLVDNGTGMVDYHKDAPNGNHCNKTNCLMYYATETSDIVGNLLGGEVPALENFCIRDLQFNGGK